MKTLFRLLAFIAISSSCISSYCSTISTNEIAVQTTVLREVNQFRKQHNRPPLELSPIISQQAKLHSQDMATHRMKFGHSDFTKRIDASCRHIKGCRGGAENIAYNYKLSVLVDGWIHSPGHRQNILGHYNLTGIGVAWDKQGRPYYTQLFIRNN